MKLKHIIYTLILSFACTAAFAQPVTATSYEDMLATADASAQNKDYKNAIDWFKKAYKESKDNDLYIPIGDLYMRLRDYKNASRSYERLLKRDRDGSYEFLRLDYAKSLKYMGKYKDALNELRVVASTTEEDSIKNIALFEIEGLEKFDSYAQNIEAVVEFAGDNVNSGSGENSPSIYPDGTLYYSSFNRRKDIVLDGEEEDWHAKIYRASKNDEGIFEKGKPLNKRVNREGYNNAGVSFSADGKIMYFTRATLDVNEVLTSKIFYSFKNDSGWGAPSELNLVEGDFKAMHPVVGELFGNKVLFFVSDMDGGYGGLDIYYSNINGDSYSSPVNLGESINTDKDDITPFYQSGTLYYSSNGKPGFGGHDIWYATWNGASFQDVTNMGFNYNSPADDMYLRFTPRGSSGYLVSNRPSKEKKKLNGSDTCCDDIYSVQLREVVIDLALLVEDENGPLGEATTEVIDLSVLEDAVQSKTNVSSNDFNFLLDADHKYRVVVSREGYYPDTTVSFNTMGVLDSYTVNKTVILKPLPVVEPDDNGGEIIDIITANQPIRLNSIYFDFDDDEILPDAETDLAYLQSILNQYPEIVIELSSHTDAQGKDSYNRTLSQRRANSTKQWLVERGISTARIKAVGYGETQITNHCVNGVKCSDTEHRTNRRSEFKIISGPQTIEVKRQTKTTRTTGSSGGGGAQSFIQDEYPQISFVKDSINVGTLERGEQKAMEFHFTNTGNADLLIEIVSTCKCTNLEWPSEAVKPGEQGVIKATYDTTSQKPGFMVKTIDIISNTKSIVNEVRFSSTLVEKKTKTEE